MIASLNSNRIKISYPKTIGFMPPFYAGPYTIPRSYNYTWYNQGSISVNDRPDRLVLTLADDGVTNSIHILARSIPFSTPYTVTMIAGANWSIAWNGAATVGNSLGIALGSSGNSWRTLIFNRKYGNSGPVVQSWTSATAFSSTIYDGTSRWQKANEAFICLRITDDGSNRKFYSSINGLSWWQHYSEATNTYVTPTQVGFLIGAVNGGNSSGYWSGGDASQLISNKVDIIHFDIKPGIYGDEP